MASNSAQDAAFISANAASYIASTYTTSAKDAKAPALVLEAECLKSLNAFLDYFLAIVIRDAKSTDLQDLKGTLAQLLDSALGYVALNEAQAELETYRNQETGAGRKFEYDVPKKNVNGVEMFDVESIWLQARIRCMIYSTVGEKEESDFPTLSDDDTPVTPPVAIFLTAVLEFLGEHILLTSGRFARDRLGSSVQGTLTQNDLERGIKMDKALNAIWSDYQSIIPSVVETVEPPVQHSRQASIASANIVAPAPTATDRPESRTLSSIQEPVLLRKASPALNDSRPTTSESQSRAVAVQAPSQQFTDDFESMMSGPAVRPVVPSSSSNVLNEKKELENTTKTDPESKAPEPVAPLDLQKKEDVESSAVTTTKDLAPPLSSNLWSTTPLAPNAAKANTNESRKASGPPPLTTGETIGSPNSNYSPIATPASTSSSFYNYNQGAKSPGLWSRNSSRSTSAAETQKTSLWRKQQAEEAKRLSMIQDIATPPVSASALKVPEKNTIEDRPRQASVELKPLQPSGQKAVVTIQSSPEEKATPAVSPTAPVEPPQAEQTVPVTRTTTSNTRNTDLRSSQWSQNSAEEDEPKAVATEFDPDAYQWKSRRMQIPGVVPVTRSVEPAREVPQATSKPTRSQDPNEAQIFGSVIPRKSVSTGLAAPKVTSPTREIAPLRYGNAGLGLREATPEPGSDYERFLQEERLRDAHAGAIHEPVTSQPSATDLDEAEARRMRILAAREAALAQQTAQPDIPTIEAQQPRYEELEQRTPPVGLAPSTKGARGPSIEPRAPTTAPVAGSSQTLQLAQFLRSTGPVRNTPRAIPLLAAVSREPSGTVPASAQSPSIATPKETQSMISAPAADDDDNEGSYHDTMFGRKEANRGESLAEFLTNVPPPPSIISDPQSNGAQRLPSRTTDDNLIAGPAYGSSLPPGPPSRIVSSSSAVSETRKSIPLLGPRSAPQARIPSAPIDLEKRNTITDQNGKIKWPTTKTHRMTSRSAVITHEEEDEGEESDDSIFGEPRRKPKTRESLVDFLRDTAPPGFNEREFEARKSSSSSKRVVSATMGSRSVSRKYTPLIASQPLGQK